ncbi:MAG: alpha/beta fold hydrolase, partial [Pseudomonadota bacterium]
MKRALAAAALALSGGGAGAETCGGVDAPCGAAGGEYHFAAPDPAIEDPPAVIFLHGFGGTGKGIIRNQGLVGGLTDRGYAVIAPQGLPFREGMRGGSWNSFARETRRDDVAFINAVADDAAARHGIDRDRILIGGFSGGGMMTWRVACDAPESFAAYAPIAGLLWRPLPEACAGPFRMQHTHGWSDTVVPIEGRSVAGGQFTQGDLFAGLDLLRDAMGCAKDDPDEYGAEGAYLIRRWTDCARGAGLEMALHPGGHAIPRGWSA